MSNPQKPDIVVIDGDSLTLTRAAEIARGARVVLARSVQKRMQDARELVVNLAKTMPIYGVNTGFGYLAAKRISPGQLQQLQKNLIMSHAAGFGPYLPIPETRLSIALRINVLTKGYTGVRFALCQALTQLLQAEIYPLIPEFGSVGANGDLVPLSHLALPLIGLGLVHFHNKIVPAAQALKAANLKPFKLDSKEGLSLINGTQIMLAVGGLALADAAQVLDKADKVCALSYEGLCAQTAPLDPQLHEARRQIGQKESAANIYRELKGSYLFNAATSPIRLQDPYSLRCAPQIHGPSRDAVRHCTQIIENELNAATDNPLVFAEQRKIISGGNFHGQGLALAFDYAAMAIAELGNVSERRLELLLNPHMSGLPPFLTPREGIHSGYMAMQYLSASLVNENKLLANPSCTDSIPGNVGIEDHVSMGMTSARKFKKIVENVKVILTAELLAAAQAVDLRKIKKLGKGTRNTYRVLRQAVPKLQRDRILHEDLAKGTAVFENI